MEEAFEIKEGTVIHLHGIPMRLARRTAGMHKLWSTSDKCGHGKKWGECCPLCDTVWFANVTLPELRRECTAALQFFESNQGAAEDAEKVCGLISAIRNLVKAIDEGYK
jgi:hypothetical protein